MAKQRKQTYVGRLLRSAWTDSREEIRGHIRSTAVTGIVSFALGAGTGGTQGGFLGALVGGIGAPLLVAIGFFLWKLLCTPAALHRQQAEEIRKLQQDRAGQSGSLVTVDVIPKVKASGSAFLLELQVIIENSLDQSVTIRPLDLKLFRDGQQVDADFLPIMGFDPLGRLADFNNFPEGQHTVPPHSSVVRYFMFSSCQLGTLGDGLELLVRMAVPEKTMPIREFRLPISQTSLPPSTVS